MPDSHRAASWSRRRLLLALAGIASIVAVATFGSSQWNSTELQAGSAPCPEIQGFEVPQGCDLSVSGVDVIACFGTAPNTSLECSGGSEHIATPGSAIAMYQVFKATRGHRNYTSVTYTPGEWGFSAGTLGAEVGRFTMRTDLGCDAYLNIVADAQSGGTFANWPSPSNWTGVQLKHRGVGATQPRTTVKRTPPSFVATSSESGLATTAAHDGLGGLLTLPSAYLPNVRPIPIDVLTEESPFRQGLRTTTMLIGDPVDPPRNDFPCIDTPYDVVLKNTQLTAPTTAGLYPRWTVLYSEPDLRTGKVTIIVDHQCVHVGTAPTDTDGDCLSDTAEAVLSTDDEDADSDNDGLRDGLEIAAGSLPTEDDIDADNANDFDELVQFTNPNINDTDGDGQKDLQRVWSSTPSPSNDNCPSVFNPNQANSDTNDNRSAPRVTGFSGVLLTDKLMTSEQTVNVESTHTFTEASGWIVIEGELLQYSSKTSNTFTLASTPTSEHKKRTVAGVGTKLTAAIVGGLPLTGNTYDVPVQWTEGFPDSGYLYLLGGGEFVHYTSKDNNSFFVDARGLSGTLAAAHAANSPVVLAEDETSTTLDVGSASQALPSGGVVEIDGERAAYASRDLANSLLTGVRRGAEGTLARLHASSVRVAAPDVAAVPYRSAGYVFFVEATVPRADVYGDACDNDDDNDWLVDIAERYLRIKAYTGDGSNPCSLTPGPPTTASATPTGTPVVLTPTDPTRRDTDGDRFLDGAECIFGSRPDISYGGTSETPVTWDRVARCILSESDPDGCAVPRTPAASGAGWDADTDALYARTLVHNTVERLLRTMGIWDPSLNGVNDNPDGDADLTGDDDADSDNDKLRDGWELKYYGTNPLDADTDDDGCSDGKEAADFNGDRQVNHVDQGIMAFGIADAGAYVDASGRANPLYTELDINKSGGINPSDQGIQAGFLGTGSCGVSDPVIVKVAQ